jgi:hypothetical protein
VKYLQSFWKYRIGLSEIELDGRTLPAIVLPKRREFLELTPELEARILADTNVRGMLHHGHYKIVTATRYKHLTGK